MARLTVAGNEPGQRLLNGPQTTGRDYRILSAPEYATRVDASQRAMMRDGVSLLADVLRPDAPGRFPALVAASPYPRQLQNSGVPFGFIEAGASDFFVPRGYGHVIANSRGTGGSGGDYDFFGPGDRRDMFDLIEWTAAQPWCDGNVGMIGISAFAVLQLAAAVERPPHLRAIFPLLTTVDPYEAAYHNGLLSATFISGWLKSLGTLNGVSDGILRGPMLRFAERVLHQPAVHSRLQHFNGEAALSALGRFMPARYPPRPWDEVFEAVAAEHPTRDQYWRERDLVPLLSEVAVPVYLGCDWANVPLHLPGTFSALAALPPEPAVRVALLVPGAFSWPWECLHVEALAWFDHWLKQRETGVLDGPPIRYQMPAAPDSWRTSDRWPPAGVSYVRLQLAANGALASGEQSEGSRDYVSIPQDPRGGRRLAAGSLIWDTRPLRASIEMAGPAELVLQAASTAIDTAWIVTLQDVAPDGVVVDVTAGWLRASLRAVDEARSSEGKPYHPCDRPEAVPVNDRVEYRIGLVDNARAFQVGHRIRIVLASDDTSDTPAMMGFRHAAIGLPARNTVFSSSQLLLPVLGSEPDLG